MNIYWTADWHINHANIIKYAGRTLFMNERELTIYNNFLKELQEKNANIGGIQKRMKQFIISRESVLKMNKELIDRCNERVKENDTLYFLGDVGFKSGTGRGEGEPEKLENYLSQIKCKHVIYIEGNHDVAGRNSFKTPIQKIFLKYGGKNICLVHNPENIDANCELNLTAHVHQKWQIMRIRKGFSFTDAINVGVDVWNYYPVDWSEINQRYHQWLKEQK